MNSQHEAAVNGSSGRQSKKSITNKLSSFLSRSSTHINSHSIKLDDPLRQYGPGDTVTGTVVLDVAKPLGVTHIVACLYGYVQVFKNHSKSSVTNRPNTNRVVSGQIKRWVSEYYGDGFASLFEEEVVLCGEGRLDPHVYHFGFSIDFPTDMALPSSIDFERGTIHYMVWSTITRPSPVIATQSCEAKVFFREHIDVASLPPPKPREVTLRAVEPGHKPRNGVNRLTSTEKKRSSRASTTSKTNQSCRTVESRETMSASRDPSISDRASRSSSSSRNRVASLASEIRSSQHSTSPRRIDLDNDFPYRSISVTVEPARMGCLPGDVLPIFIRVNHIKVIQSPRGIIVTLYRQARVDMHPNLPVVSNSRSREGKYEDYYPRSKTGLGGLSLTAAGSSQVWRKDLTQSFSPLYIDPHTKSAEVKVAVRVPDEAFPTIDNVPGEMISFKYFAEVIIDIHGKLGAGDRLQPNHIPANNQSSFPNTPRGQAMESADYMGYVMDNDCIDTSAIRREKNAVVVQCDVMVATRDSEKSRGKRKAVNEEMPNNSPGISNVQDTMYATVDAFPSTNGTNWRGSGEEYDLVEQEQYFGHAYQGAYYGYDDDAYYDPSYDPYHGYPETAIDTSTLHPNILNGSYSSTYSNIPRPDMIVDTRISEKQRLRDAEDALLPSRPPESDTATQAHSGHAPTAPDLPEEADLHLAWNTPTVLPIRTTYQRESSFTNGVNATTNGGAETGTPEGAFLSNGNTNGHSTHRDDKQEFELQRLQGQRTAPSETGTAEYNNTPSAPPAEDVENATDDRLQLGRPNDLTASDYEMLNQPTEYLPRYEQ